MIRALNFLTFIFQTIGTAPTRPEADLGPLMFHYSSIGSRIPPDHPLRPTKKVAETALSAISGRFDGLYGKIRRPS